MPAQSKARSAFCLFSHLLSHPCAQSSVTRMFRPMYQLRKSKHISLNRPLRRCNVQKTLLLIILLSIQGTNLTSPFLLPVLCLSLHAGRSIRKPEGLQQPCQASGFPCREALWPLAVHLGKQAKSSSDTHRQQGHLDNTLAACRRWRWRAQLGKPNRGCTQILSKGTPLLLAMQQRFSWTAGQAQTHSATHSMPLPACHG